MELVDHGNPRHNRHEVASYPDLHVGHTCNYYFMHRYVHLGLGTRPVLGYWLIDFLSHPCVTDIQLNKLRARFHARFVPIISANCIPAQCMGRQ